MSASNYLLPPEIAHYVRLNSMQEQRILADLRAETESLAERNMQTSPEQAQLISLLVMALSAKRVLEIGTFTGYGTLAIALAMPDNGRIVTCDVSSKFTSVARRYWQRAAIADKIDLRIAPALGTLQDLIDSDMKGQYDFAYIDADKENYTNYYELCLQLIRQNGIILVDNTLWGGKVVDLSKTDEETEAIRSFNSYVCCDDRVTMSLVPIGDGLTFICKR